MGSGNAALSEREEMETCLKILCVRTRRGGLTWQALGALVGLGGGTVAAAFGGLLSAAAWVCGDEAGGLSVRGVGSALLLSTIPLLIFGAHCLDLLERRTGAQAAR